MAYSEIAVLVFVCHLFLVVSFPVRLSSSCKERGCDFGYSCTESEVFPCVTNPCRTESKCVPDPHARGSHRKMLVGYWGQNSAGATFGPKGDEEDLVALCANSKFDIIVVAFLNNLFDPKNKDELPGLNIANHCSTSVDPQYPTLLRCPSIEEGVNMCHRAGKKVLISVGGPAADGTLFIPDWAKKLAHNLWNLFLGGANMKNLRPFGSAVLDGVDIHLQAGDYHYYPQFITELRMLMDTDTSKRYLITAAPHCSYPDHFLGPEHPSKALTEVGHLFDHLYVQFYNSYCSPTLRVELVKWLRFATHNKPKGPQVFIGVPAAKGASQKDEDYIDVNQLEGLLENIRDLPPIGGIMLWDASWDRNNIIKGKRYHEYVKDAMDLHYSSTVPPTAPSTIPTTRRRTSQEGTTKPSSASSTASDKTTVVTPNPSTIPSRSTVQMSSERLTSPTTRRQTTRSTTIRTTIGTTVETATTEGSTTVKATEGPTMISSGKPGSSTKATTKGSQEVTTVHVATEIPSPATPTTRVNEVSTAFTKVTPPRSTTAVLRTTTAALTTEVVYSTERSSTRGSTDALSAKTTRYPATTSIQEVSTVEVTPRTTTPAPRTTATDLTTLRPSTKTSTDLSSTKTTKSPLTTRKPDKTTKVSSREPTTTASPTTKLTPPTPPRTTTSSDKTTKVSTPEPTTTGNPTTKLSRPTPPRVTTSSEKPTTRKQTVRPTTQSIRLFCRGKQGGEYKDPTNCYGYIQCAHGRTFQRKCPGGLKFNDKYKVCDWAYNVKCD